MESLYDTLVERGLIYQMTDDKRIKELLDGEPQTIYLGVDPTADSLHIGHCLPLLILRRMQEYGHKIIIVVGGATAMIGDPTGKRTMRKMVTHEFIESNLASIKGVISRFLKFDGENPCIIVNNYDWFKDFSYLDFMREVGVHFNVSKMLASEACKARINDGGLTFFEMGYQLLQAYDFYYLNRHYGCNIELGGSDQWGNIVAGVEFGRKMNFLDGVEEEFQALTVPLLLNSEGKKMGKTENGAIWVLKEKLSSYDFFQYFYGINDEDVENKFLMLTDVSISEIKEIMKGDIRDAKQRLAYEITKFVRGKEEADEALSISKNLFEQNNFDNAPSVEYSAEKISQGVKLVDLVDEIKFFSSKSEARRMIQQNGLSLNGEKVTCVDKVITMDDVIDGTLQFKKGKKNFLKVIVK